MTGLEWALAAYMTGVALSMIAAVLVAARKAAFDRVTPNRDPLDRYHDMDGPMFIVVAGVAWPLVPFLVVAWLVWRAVVFLFELPLRRRTKDAS